MKKIQAILKHYILDFGEFHKTSFQINLAIYNKKQILIGSKDLFAIHICYRHDDFCNVQTLCVCRICGRSIIYFHKIQENGDYFEDCEEREITLDQYNAGVLNPICYECDEILNQFYIGDITFRYALITKDYIRPRSFHFLDLPGHFKRLTRLLKHLFFADPEIPTNFFEIKEK